MYWHDTIPLTGWGTSATSYNVLESYSNAYAFGAWLVRNYGGPALLRRIVQGSETDESAIVNAVNALNPGRRRDLRLAGGAMGTGDLVELKRRVSIQVFGGG